MSPRIVRRVYLLLLLALFGACVDSTDTSWVSQEGGTPTVTTDQTTYAANTPIQVTWTGTQGNQNDWISIVTAGSAPNMGFKLLTYTNGQVDGTFTFTNGLAPGNYEVRSYIGGSYTIIATSSITVTGGPPPPPTATVTTNKASYRRNEPISVTWQGTPGNQNDWIAIVKGGSAPNAGFVQLTFTNGAQNGSFVFNGIATTGDYQVRAYRGGSYTILGSANISVTSVTTSAPTYTINSPITVNWSFNPGNANDYVTINTLNSPANSGFLRLVMTNSVRTGSTQFMGLAAGTYEARSYRGGGFEILDSVTFTVAGNPPPPPALTTNMPTYAPNQQITVNWVSMPGRPQDWVAIVPANSPANSGFIQLFYVNSEVNGSRIFNGLAPGSYEVRYYNQGAYTIVATAAFSVTGSTGGMCTPPQTPPVVGSITSGDLVIDSTQQSNSVALTVPLASSVLFTSMRENEPSPNFGGAMCTLHDADPMTMAAAGITCLRNNAGTDTGSGSITIHYTVVTFTSGVTVQRGVANTGFTNPSTITLTAVNPSETFVLLNGIAVGGTGWGANEFVRAVLVNGTTLDVRTNTAGTRVSWQVVQMTGAQVQRGTVSMASAATSLNRAITATPSGTFVLASYNTDNASAVAAGAMSLSTRMSTPSNIQFTRSLGGTALDISYEVVSLPFAVYSGVTSFAAGQSSRTESVPGITATSSVAIAGSQAILGQATGSTTYNGPAVDLVGEAAATFAAGAGSLVVERGTSQASASIPWAVLDFAHNCNGL